MTPGLRRGRIAKHHLVVTHEVTNQGTDRAQLSSMGQQTQEALGTDKFTALADRGYYAGPEILKCEQVGINALVPKSHTSNNLAPRGCSTNATFATTLPAMSTDAQPVSGRFGASRPSSTAC